MFESEKSKGVQLSDKNTIIPGAFVGHSGCLYVRVWRLQPSDTGDLYHQQTAIYPSVETYNTRSVRPEYKLLPEIIDDYDRPVHIDLATLTIDS